MRLKSELILLQDKENNLQICSYFGCAKELTLQEKLCGDKCMEHQKQNLNKGMPKLADKVIKIEIKEPEIMIEPLPPKSKKHQPIGFKSTNGRKVPPNPKGYW